MHVWSFLPLQELLAGRSGAAGRGAACYDKRMMSVRDPLHDPECVSSVSSPSSLPPPFCCCSLRYPRCILYCFFGPLAFLDLSMSVNCWLFICGYCQAWFSRALCHPFDTEIIADVSAANPSVDLASLV